MSEVKVNKISPRTNCGTVTLGDSGDTFTIPSGATITNNGTATGFGATGAVNWNTTPKVTGDSPITAVSGTGYFLNTTGGSITVNLPAGSAGDIVGLADYAGTFQTYSAVVSPNGSEKIGGGVAGESATLGTQGQSVTFVYVDAVEGWVTVNDSSGVVVGEAFITATGGTPSQDGNYEIRTFTGPGTFTVTGVASVAANNDVDYIIVGGGAAGGSGSFGEGGGGGGAGGYRESPGTATCYTASPRGAAPATAITVSASPGAYPIAVGGGGAGGPGPGGCGVASSFACITGAVGGGGGGHYGSPTTRPGKDGGSAGGGAGQSPGGTGNTPPVTPIQGMAGGSGAAAPKYSAGGGGGATVAGTSATNPSPGGAGGDGATSEITGAAVARAGGGGGSGGQPGACGGVGGAGGGGAGTPGPCGAADGVAGGCNTGGGGGGGGSSNPSGCGGNGGSGVVIIRYRRQ